MKSVLLLIVMCIVIAGCTSSAERIEQDIEAANYCNTADDCALVGSKCPFGCYIYVNNAEAERISGLVESYESTCVYSCIACQNVACVENKCTPICE